MQRILRRRSWTLPPIRFRDGSLFLFCVTPSFTTRRQFSPAHRARAPAPPAAPFSGPHAPKAAHLALRLSGGAESLIPIRDREGAVLTDTRRRPYPQQRASCGAIRLVVPATREALLGSRRWTLLQARNRRANRTELGTLYPVRRPVPLWTDDKCCSGLCGDRSLVRDFTGWSRLLDSPRFHLR
jgi:hypothetical protein